MSAKRDIAKETHEIMEAKVEPLQVKMEQQLAAVQRERQLPALQSWMESLHPSKLLTDERALQVDGCHCRQLRRGGRRRAASEAQLLSLLSERLTSDPALARQLWQKFA